MVLSWIFKASAAIQKRYPTCPLVGQELVSEALLRPYVKKVKNYEQIYTLIRNIAVDHIRESKQKEDGMTRLRKRWKHKTIYGNARERCTNLRRALINPELLSAMLEHLREQDVELFRVVYLKFFCCTTNEVIRKLLGFKSTSGVQYRLSKAYALIKKEYPDT